ncbi:MAG: hypothetical protein IJZ15_01590 [Oscillospiraceae bacterium]|nr:hypothetical protein [Oscillospiraceae bacterium]
MEDLIADDDTKAYTSSAGDIYPGGSDEATTVEFDFTDELYTHRLGEKVYWVAYYVDVNGVTYYTSLNSTTIVAVAETVSGQDTVSDEEKAVLSSIQTLKQAVVDFRGEGLGGSKYPAGVTVGNSGISFNQNGATGTYRFGTIHQIRLIEPWSIRVTLYIQDAATETSIDFAGENVHYGMIFYHDKDNTYADGMSIAEMIAESNALVYSSSTSNLSLATDSVIAVYDKGIYTYQLDTNLYCLPYVEINGDYYYRSSVICWNLKNEMVTFSQDTTLSEKEIAVFNAMIDLHEKTIAYRKTK